MDREVKTANNMTNNYNVNEYTIRYDSNTKRFFKGFAPKVGYGVITSGAVLAGLGVATVATGGLFGIAAGTVVGTSVAAGAISQAIHSGFIYARNSSKSRFKHMGIGGKSNAVGTIELIEQVEQEALERVKLLEQEPNTKEFEVDGKKYSRNALKREVKEKEDIVYHGLKYLLEQGLLVSDKINSLAKRDSRTSRQDEALEQYYAIMERIAECTKSMASQRITYNPYKNLIVQYMCKGCLLGFNDKQNNQIRLLRNMKDKDSAFKIYSNMYETPLRASLIEERQATLRAEKEIEAEYESNKAIVAELIKYDGDIMKIKESNQAKAYEFLKYQNYMAAIKAAQVVMRTMPSELFADKAKIEKSIKALQGFIVAKNEGEMENEAAILDNLIAITQDKNNMAYIKKGKTAAAESWKKALEAYKATRAKLVSTEKQLSAEKGTSANLRKKVEQSDKKIGSLQSKLGEAYADDLESARYAKSILDKCAQTLLDEFSNRDLASNKVLTYHIGIISSGLRSKSTANKNLEVYKKSIFKLYESLSASKAKEISELIDNLNEANKYLMNTTHELIKSDRARKKAEDDAEYAISGWYESDVANKELTKNLSESNEYLMNTTHELVKSDRENQKLKTEKEEAFKTIEKQTEEIKLNISEVEKLKNQLTNSQKEKQEEKVRADAADKRAASAEKKVQKAEKKVSAEKLRADVAESNVERLKGEKTDLERKLGEIEEHNAKLVEGQGKNINTITELTDENEKLKNERELSQSKSKRHQQIIEDLAQDRYKLEKELDIIMSERDAYKQGVEQLQDENAKLESQLEDANNKVNDMQSDIDYRNYKRDIGGAIRRLVDLMNKADVHATVSQLATQTTNKDIKLVMASVDTLRGQDLNNMSIEDLQIKRKALETLYKASDSGLVKVDKEELSEMASKLNKVINKNQRRAAKFGPLKPEDGGWGK